VRGGVLRRGVALAAVPLALVLLAGCSSQITQPEPQVIEEITFDASLGVDLSAMTKTASGLYYQDVEVGEGPTPQTGDHVVVRYAGYLSDGTQFDANDLDYEVSPGSLIPGWEEAVGGMKEGGVRKAVIPPELGYGSAGRGAIPGGAVLIFDLELLQLDPAGA
jgi:FKBP-type peptidyl-prolyl cis-trans isomerase